MRREIEIDPPDLLGEKCECGSNKWIDTGGITELAERILECANCGKIVYGCD